MIAIAKRFIPEGVGVIVATAPGALVFAGCENSIKVITMPMIIKSNLNLINSLLRFSNNYGKSLTSLIDADMAKIDDDKIQQGHKNEKIGTLSELIKKKL